MRWLRALFAFLVSIALLVGIPVLLLKVVGNPWSGVHEMFTAGNMTDQGVLDVLAVIALGAAAVAWLQFTAAFIAEFASVRRAVKYGRRPARPRHLPLVLTSQSRLAHSLVTALLLIGPALFSAVGPGVTAAFAAAPAPAATSSATAGVTSYAAVDHGHPATSSPVATAEKTPAKASTTPVTVTSSGPRTWWDLAEHYLGAGDRWQQLWNLNQGQTQPDGTVMSSPNATLRPGWTVSVPAAAAAAHAADPPAVHAAPPAHVVVRAGDTLSEIAQDELGDANLYPQLAQANHIADPDDLEVGQALTIPGTLIDQAGRQAADSPGGTTAAGVRAVHVQPGDTLSEIAQREMGSADLYHQLAAANHITDPDDIDAGAVLVIPTPATSTATPTAHTTTPTTHPATPTGYTTPPHTMNHRPTPAPGRSATPASSSSTSSAPTSTNAAAPTGALGQNTGQPPAPARPTSATQHPTTATAQPAAAASDSTFAEIVGGIGGGLGAVLLAGIAVARRRKGRKRPTGEVPRPVSLPATRVERHLRERAGGADVAWMDTALRSAAALCADRPADQLPDVTAVWLSKQELQLQLATAVPAPEPFIAEGTDWVLPTGTELSDRTETASPFPALVSLGESDGETFLVDLERIGALTVTGDKQHTADLLRHVAVEYGHSLWSDHLQVYLVGWGHSVVALRPDRLSYAPSISDVVTMLKGRLREVQEVQAEGATTVLQSRIGDQHTVEDPWTPTILLIDAHAAEDLEPLAEVLRGLSGVGRSAVAVVTRTEQVVAGSATAHIEPDGQLQLPAVLSNQLRVQAAGLTQAALDELLELFAAAGQFSKPGPVFDTTETWSADMSVMGSLLAPSTTAAVAAGPVAEPPPATAVVDEDNTDKQTDAGRDDEAAEVDHTGQVVPLRPALAEAQQVLAKALSDDSDLDADVDEWWINAPNDVDPDADKTWVRRPRIGVLGTPLVLTRGKKPADRINRFTEMAVYLAIHREVDADQFAGDLWPTGDTPTGDNRRSYVSRVRSWMGTDPQDGRNYLPTARLKPYRLERLLDIELFRRLRKRADAYLNADDRNRAMTDLCSALDLVRGPVLENHPRTGYTWSTTNDEADLKDANLMMLETAHLLVDLALADGDIDLARQAADVGYRVDHKADMPLVDHMRIAHQVGDDQKARGWLTALLQANEIELAEDLPNYKTFEAVNEVFPNGLPTAANN